MAIPGAPYTVMAAQVCKTGFFDLFRAMYILKNLFCLKLDKIGMMLR